MIRTDTPNLLQETSRRETVLAEATGGASADRERDSREPLFRRQERGAQRGRVGDDDDGITIVVKNGILMVVHSVVHNVWFC